MMKERFEQRLFRIFAQAGYSPVQLLTVTPEGNGGDSRHYRPQHPGGAVRPEQGGWRTATKSRSGRLMGELLKEAGESR